MWLHLFGPVCPCLLGPVCPYLHYRPCIVEGSLRLGGFGWAFLLANCCRRVRVLDDLSCPPSLRVLFLDWTWARSPLRMTTDFDFFFVFVFLLMAFLISNGCAWPLQALGRLCGYVGRSCPWWPLLDEWLRLASASLAAYWRMATLGRCKPCRLLTNGYAWPWQALLPLDEWLRLAWQALQPLDEWLCLALASPAAS